LTGDEGLGDGWRSVLAAGHTSRSERQMSDVEVTFQQPLTRGETSRWLSTLAAALADEGEVELQLGDTRMKVHVPAEVRGKVEVEIDHGEVEFEVELTWSTATPAHTEAAAPAAAPTAAPASQAEQEPADEEPAGNRKSARRKVGAR
jgi:amphi-Trp domain-containing protein